MAWTAIPTGLELVTGADFSATQRYLNTGTTIHCEGGFGVLPVDLPLALLELIFLTGDTYAADNVSALAEYDLVQIYTVGGTSGGCEGGWFTCDDRNDPPTNSFYSEVSVVLDGIGDELRAFADGALRPILNPYQANFTPDSDGLFMRDTALEWPGQDPTNDANRSVWLPSEVIGVIGAASLRHVMGFVASYDVYFGTGVRALKITNKQPVICFV